MATGITRPKPGMGTGEGHGPNPIRNPTTGNYTPGGANNPWPAGATAPGATADVESRSGKGRIRAILMELGLPEVAAQRLTDWAWGQLQDGMSFDEVIVELYQQPDFKAEFPELEARRNAGLTPVSPAEIVEYRRAAQQLMRSSGLPAGFFDHKTDFTNLIVADVSISELNDRIQKGWRRVSQAPVEVREAFSDMFGAQGDTALAMWFLDDERAMPVLEEAVEVGFIAGTGRRFGYDLGHGRAQRLAEIGVTEQQAQSGFSQLAELDVAGGLFTETVSEATDLTVEDEGVDAVFGVDGGGAEALKKREQQRKAQFGGGGGAGLSQGGLGLGSRRQ